MLKWLRGRTPAAPDTPAPAPKAAEPVIEIDDAALEAAALAAGSPEDPRRNPDDLMREAFALHEGGETDAAGALYRDILSIDPNYADAHYLLGRIEQEAGRLDEALPHLRAALRANNREPAFHRSVGELFYQQGHWNEAVAYFANAAELKPQDPQLWTNLALSHQRLGQLGEASRYFQKALEVAETSPDAINNVAMSLKDRGRIDEAVEMFEKGLALAPGHRDLLDNYLYTLNFSTRHAPAAVFEAHAAYDRHFGSGTFEPLVRAAVDRDPARRLRVGYFSPDLRSHPVAVFLEPVLREHDRTVVEVVCYHLHPWADQVTRRLQASADRWVDCRGLDDDTLAARIVEDHIDILVDLAGHTGNNRLPVLGRKPAPVQMTWLGYPGTTGLRTVEYKVTDALSDPPGAEALHCETLLRLPHRQWCFSAPDVAAEVMPLPALERNALRFGSFNHASKLNDETLRMWAELLRWLPGSSLLIWGVAEEQAGEIRELMIGEGIEPERLELHDRSSFPAQLRLYQRVDIALDTYPYSGVTTTFNSLWMGVPVLTRTGGAVASRSTHAILDAVGLGDWTASAPEAWLACARRHAADLPALAALRDGLRARLQASALMDAPAFTRGLEAAYRQAWREHCEKAP